jgi:hypothetical protein
MRALFAIANYTHSPQLKKASQASPQFNDFIARMLCVSITHDPVFIHCSSYLWCMVCQLNIIIIECLKIIPSERASFATLLQV